MSVCIYSTGLFIIYIRLEKRDCLAVSLFHLRRDSAKTENNLMKWIQTSSAIFDKDEIVGLQFDTSQTSSRPAMTIILRGGGTIFVSGEDAEILLEDIKQELKPKVIDADEVLKDKTHLR